MAYSLKKHQKQALDRDYVAGTLPDPEDVPAVTAYASQLNMRYRDMKLALLDYKKAAPSEERGKSQKRAAGTQLSPARPAKSLRNHLQGLRSPSLSSTGKIGFSHVGSTVGGGNQDQWETMTQVSLRTNNSTDPPNPPISFEDYSNAVSQLKEANLNIQRLEAKARELKQELRDHKDELEDTGRQLDAEKAAKEQVETDADDQIRQLRRDLKEAAESAQKAENVAVERRRKHFEEEQLLKDEIRKAQDRIEDLQRTAQLGVASTGSQADEVNRLKAVNDDLRAEVKDLSTEVSDLKGEVSKREKAQQETVTELVTARSEIYEQGEIIRRLNKKYSELESTVIRQGVELDDRNDSLEKLEKEVDTLRTKVYTLEGEKKIAEEEVKVGEDALDKVKDSLKLVSEEKGKLEIELVAMRAQRDTAVANADRLGHELSSTQALASRSAQNYSDAKNELDTLRKTVSSSSQAHSQLVAAKSDLLAVQAQLQSTRDRIKDLEAKENSYKKKNDDLETEIYDCQKKLDFAEDNEKQLSNAINQMSGDLIQFQTMNTSLQVDLQTSQATIAILQADLQQAQATIASIQTDLQSAQTLNAGLQQQILTPPPSHTNPNTKNKNKVTKTRTRTGSGGNNKVSKASARALLIEGMKWASKVTIVDNLDPVVEELPSRNARRPGLRPRRNN